MVTLARSLLVFLLAFFVAVALSLVCVVWHTDAWPDDGWMRLGLPVAGALFAGAGLWQTRNTKKAAPRVRNGLRRRSVGKS